MANFRNENKCATVKSMLKTERNEEEWRVIISQRERGVGRKKKKAGRGKRTCVRFRDVPFPRSKAPRRKLILLAIC